MVIVKRKNSKYSISLCSYIINPRWNYCEQFYKFNFRSFKTTSNKLKMHRLLCKRKLYNSLPPCVYVRVDVWFICLSQIYLFIFIFGCGGSSLLHTGFLQLQRVGLLLVVVCRLLIAVASLLLQSTGSGCAGFSACSMRPQQLRLMGLVASWHVGNSGTRDQTRVPFIAWWLVNHWTTRKVPTYGF